MSEVYDQIPDDLIPVAERLKAARPTLSPERLALAWERVLRCLRPARDRGGAAKRLWRPRLVLTGMLVLGIMLSTTGAGLAISGLAGSGSAGKAQYGSSGGVQGKQVSGGGGQGAGTGANAPGQTQATTGKSGLPFTGLTAIPLILAGGALLITGVGLRRRT